MEVAALSDVITSHTWLYFNMHIYITHSTFTLCIITNISNNNYIVVHVSADVGKSLGKGKRVIIIVLTKLHVLSGLCPNEYIHLIL